MIERIMTTNAINDLKSFIRNPHDFGYSKVLIMSDGCFMCHACAKENYKRILKTTRTGYKDGWSVAGQDIYWEGPDLECCNCGATISSEYGDTSDE